MTTPSIPYLQLALWILGILVSLALHITAVWYGYALRKKQRDYPSTIFFALSLCACFLAIIVSFSSLVYMAMNFHEKIYDLIYEHFDLLNMITSTASLAVLVLWLIAGIVYLGSGVKHSRNTGLTPVGGTSGERT